MAGASGSKRSAAPLAASPRAAGAEPAADAAPIITYRPHHFLCSLGFQGKGYSPDFTANMTAIVMGRLRAPGGMDQVIKVTEGLDDICAPCPKRRGGACSTPDKIAGLDGRHADALGLGIGDQLTWGDALARMRRLEPGDLDRICVGCDWLQYGMCQGALTALRTPTPRDQADTV